MINKATSKPLKSHAARSIRGQLVKKGILKRQTAPPFHEVKKSRHGACQLYQQGSGVDPVFSRCAGGGSGESTILGL